MLSQVIPIGARAPALSTGEVIAVLPVDAVLATRAVGVADHATAGGPEGVEVAIVVAGLRRGDLTLVDARRGRGDGARRREETESESRERDHDDLFPTRGVVGWFFSRESSSPL